MRANYLASGAISESTIHKTVMEWVRLHDDIAPFVMHFPNEGKRSTRYGMFLKALGMRAGVSDLFIAMPRHIYHGAWIEIKTTQGIISAAQSSFLADMTRQDYYATVCRNVDDCINTIDWYCFGKPQQNQNGISSIYSSPSSSAKR
jgi:hypothetical protein